MGHLDVAQFLSLLVVMLGAAKLLGAVAQWIGQPAVLGELVAGVLVGTSVLGLVDPKIEVVHLLAELGVVILLFEIGLETDLRKLLQVGGASAVVAVVGVVLPFALGYAVCRMLDLGNLVAIVAGAALTATSVGITARVLSDLNRLQEPESQIILGAAVIDDVIGLVILSVVAGLTQGQGVTVLGVARTTGLAFGFLAGTLLVGMSVRGRNQTGRTHAASRPSRHPGRSPAPCGLLGALSAPVWPRRPATEQGGDCRLANASSHGDCRRCQRAS